MAYIPHKKHVLFEYSKITEHIFLGTNQCCQVHFKKSLLDKGIKADISVEKEKIDSPEGVDYFLWIPVMDHHAPTGKQMLLGAKAIKDLVDNKLKVYVHCQRGHGRSPALVVAYFILEGLSSAEAIKKVRAKRKSMHLKRPQIKALKDFEKRLRK